MIFTILWFLTPVLAVVSFYFIVYCGTQHDSGVGEELSYRALQLVGLYFIAFPLFGLLGFYDPVWPSLSWS